MRRLRALALVLAAPPLAAAADDAADLGEALTGGTVSVELRHRYERVEEDAFDRPANASTLRTVLGYRTRPLHGWSAAVRFSNVADVGAGEQHADAAGNGVTGRPVIADPERTRVDRAALAFERGETRFEGGRMSLSLDDERFVGPVGWRQNHQSFTALSLANRSLGRTALSYAFVERAWTITGAERPMDGHLIRAAVELPVGTAVGFAYLLDFDREADAAASSATIGGRFSGSRQAGRVTWRYAASWARQREHGSYPGRLRASYYRLDVGVGIPQIALDAGYEVLEGSPGEGRFSTPLATLHAFNGWADRFLSTPPGGLEDLWVGLRGRAGALAWLVAYHDFQAQNADESYGRELDLQAVWSASWKQSFGLKAAFYDARGFSTDTSKVWAWSAWSF